MTTNELLKILRNAPKPEARVVFGFARCVPTSVDSWRGIYAEPALGWAAGGHNGNVKEYPTVASLISELEDSIGEEYSGWKGGEYYYDGNETLHIDNPGDYTNTEITQVEVSEWGGEVIIHTEKQND